jgi:cytochrome c551/c552
VYTVTATDKEDTSVTSKNYFISADYIEGTDLAAIPLGHQQGEAGISGKSLVQSLDCKSCHKEAEKSIGPAYIDVARKYKDNPTARTYLAEKIINGGSGVWGEVAMAAHPSLPRSDVDQIVNWIMSLGENKSAAKRSLPQTGSLQASLGKPVKENGVLSLSASYTDNGGANIKALTGRANLLLRNNKILFNGQERMKGYAMRTIDDHNLMRAPVGKGWFAIDQIDLSGIGAVLIPTRWLDAPLHGYDLEIRLDDSTGKLIGKGSIVAPKGSSKSGATGSVNMNIQIEPVTDGNFHDVYIISRPKDAKETKRIFLGSLQFNQK